MRFRGILLLLLAVVVGGLAVFLARGWLQTQIPEPVVITEDKVPLTTVVVARRDLFFGDRLDRRLLEERSWPKETVPEGGFAKIDEMLTEERVVIRQIAKNEPVLRSKITGEGGRASLSAQIASSMRAITIRVNDILGVAGFVLPGDHVDLLLTREIGDDNPVTHILLQNVKVLGIDQNANESADSVQVARATTLEVTPEQAQKIVLAATVGNINLALRNYIDVDPTRHRAMTLADLGGSEINASPNAVLANNEGELSRRLTGGDGGLRVTVTRGLTSHQYKVERSGPSGAGGIDLRAPATPQLPPAATGTPTYVAPPPGGVSVVPGSREAPNG